VESNKSLIKAPYQKVLASVRTRSSALFLVRLGTSWAQNGIPRTGISKLDIASFRGLIGAGDPFIAFLCNERKMIHSGCVSRWALQATARPSDARYGLPVDARRADRRSACGAQLTFVAAS
jgi:hypothetical protein